MSGVVLFSIHTHIQTILNAASARMLRVSCEVM